MSAAEQQQLVGNSPERAWRRLSPLMLLVHPLTELLKFLPAVIVILFAGRSGGWSWWSIIAVVVPIVLGIGKWLTTTYRTTDTQVQLRTGLFNRNTLTAPLERVRTVDVTSTLLHRILRLATVRVGTGADKPLALDGLTRAEAQDLRTALLNRSAVLEEAPSGQGAVANGIRPSTGTGTGTRPVRRATHVGHDAQALQETTLATFSSSWLRFAPFTLTGLIAVGAVVGFGAQFYDLLDWGDAEGVVEGVVHDVGARSWWLIGLVLAVGALVVLTVASLLMYLLTYGGFRLTRQRGGTLHVARGLLTTRATSLEEKRLRGAELREPFLMRPMRGAKADALVTGSFSDGEGDTTSHLLMPPAPLGQVERVLAEVTRDAQPWTTRLRAHGPAATRRRYTRAFLPSLVVPAAVLLASLWLHIPTWLVALSILPVLASFGVGRARAAALGHAVTDEHVVARSGVFPRKRSVLRRDGVIGWTWTRTFLQRRLGLVTLRATTAAAPGYIEILDIPDDAALELVQQVGPRLIEPFLAASHPR